MAKLSGNDLRKLAIQIISENPGGIRYSHLVGDIALRSPETPKNTIHGSIWNLDALYPLQVTKPSRGLFKPVRAEDSAGSQVPEIGETGSRAKEVEFYKPFAEWLKNDLDEATDVAVIGGASMRTKWGTPDVLGVYKPLARDLIKFPLEIIAAEIKTDPSQPIVAFGQAVAYRLFASKTYIAVPRTLSEEDQSRLEALSMLFGIGLVMFNEQNVDEPAFEIRVRAQRFPADMFYVNEFADRLRLADPETFERLFR